MAAGSPAITAIFQRARRKRQKGREWTFKSSQLPLLIPDITYNTDRTYLISHMISARNTRHIQTQIFQGGFNFLLRCEQVWRNH